jgi:hypothetical protein
VQLGADVGPKPVLACFFNVHVWVSVCVCVCGARRAWTQYCMSCCVSVIFYLSINALPCKVWHAVSGWKLVTIVAATSGMDTEHIMVTMWYTYIVSCSSVQQPKRLRHTCGFALSKNHTHSALPIASQVLLWSNVLYNNKLLQPKAHDHTCQTHAHVMCSALTKTTTQSTERFSNQTTDPSLLQLSHLKC